MSDWTHDTLHDTLRDVAHQILDDQDAAILAAHRDALTNSEHGILVIDHAGSIYRQDPNNLNNLTCTSTIDVGPHPDVPHGQIHYRHAT